MSKMGLSQVKHWTDLMWCYLLYMSVCCGTLAGARDICNACRCSADRTIVSCRDARLTSVPPKLPHNVRELSLDYNYISSLGAEVFANATTLRKLYIRNNNLSYIHEKAFQNLTHLKTLALDNNWLENLPADVFAPCEGLKELSLFFNFLDLRVLNISLTSLGKLQVLDIGRNRLNGPQLPQVFSNMTHLKHLILRDTTLYNISEDYFLPLADVHLITLDLSKARIHDASSQALIHLKKLHLLDLTYSYIQASVLKSLLSGLQNSSIQTIDMAGVSNTPTNDSAFPPDLFTDLGNTKIKKLYIEDNYMGFRSEVPEQLFSDLKSLHELYMESCDLVSLSKNVFEGLRHLQKLSLRHNKLVCAGSFSCDGITRGPVMGRLKKIDFTDNAITAAGNSLIFDGQMYPGLVYLSLSNNSLELIRRGMFYNMVSLRYLDLSFNPIHTIEPHSFQSLHALQRLDVIFCPSLTTLPNDTLRGLRNMDTLHMHNNALQHVDRGALLGAQRLTELNLRGNNLGGVSFTKVQLDSPGLKVLDLGDNQITELPRGLLVCPANMTHILLDFNRITDCSGLGNLPHLEVLNLSFNSLTAPSIKCFSRLSDRRSILSLAGNPFFCDCNALDFAASLNQSGVIIERETDHICAGPKEAYGRNIFRYQISPWDCHRKFIVVPVLAAVISGLAVAIIGGIGLAWRRGSCGGDSKADTEASSDSCMCNSCSLSLGDMQPHSRRRRKSHSNVSQMTPSIISEERLIKDDEDDDIDDRHHHHRARSSCEDDFEDESDIEDDGNTDIQEIVDSDCEDVQVQLNTPGTMADSNRDSHV